MKTDRFRRVLLTIVLVATLLLPMVSWLLSLTGLHVRSLFSDDGLRWLFLHGASSMFGYATQVAFFALQAIGAMRFVRLDGSEYRRFAFLMTLLVAAVFDALLLIAIFHPRSPLVSLTGSLMPSPFLHGLPFALSVGLIICSLVYGLITRRIRHLPSFVAFLCAGMRQFPGELLFVMLLSHLWYAIRFICYL